MALVQPSPPTAGTTHAAEPTAGGKARRGTESFHTVTQLARDLGITARTIRFYEDKGLIAPQRAGNTRVYTARDRGRMILILRGKRLGFSLREIKEYLDLYDADQSQAGQIRALLAAVQKRLDMLTEQRRALETTIDELEDIQRQATEALALKVNEQRQTP
jgi:DNA-binding transcriptional MerR regulator